MTTALISIATKAIVPLTVGVGFALARRYYPAKDDRTEVEELPDEVVASFEKLQWVVGASMVVVAAVLALSLHAGLVGINHYLSRAKSVDGIRLWPQTAIWWFFPVIASISLTWEITIRAWHFLGGKDAYLYRAWSDFRAGFNATRVLRVLVLTVAAPIGIATILALPMHSTLRSSDIIECGYGFAGCRNLAYSDASRIVEIRGFRRTDGRFVNRAGIVVVYKDGRHWSSADWGNFARSVDPRVESFLISKTGLPIEIKDTKEDIGSVR